MKFIMNYYFFIYIWKEIYIINMIQSQPKLCDFVSLSDTYILVSCYINRNCFKENKMIIINRKFDIEPSKIKVIKEINFKKRNISINEEKN